MKNSVTSNLKKINDAINRQILLINEENIKEVCQVIISFLRNFVETLSAYVYCIENGINPIISSYNYNKVIKMSCEFIKKTPKFQKIKKFYYKTQQTSGHYLIDLDNTERAMFNFLYDLIEIKQFMKNKYNVEILENLNKFPQFSDDNLMMYYNEISKKMNYQINHNILDNNRKNIYYVEKVKPIFINDILYYQIVFIHVFGKNLSKTNRMIAFSPTKIQKNYSCVLDFKIEEISINNKILKLKFVTNYLVWIRDCEIKKLLSIINLPINNPSKIERENLSKLLTLNEINLLDIIELSDNDFNNLKLKIKSNAKSSVIFNMLYEYKKIIKNKNHGYITLKYLLFKIRSDVINSQIWEKNNNISGFRLKNGVLQFENLPFVMSLINHNPEFKDLKECFNDENFNDQILVRYIKNNIFNNRLFIEISEISFLKEEEIIELINIFNEKLTQFNDNEKIEIYYNKYISTKKVVDECNEIFDFFEKNTEDLSYKNFVKENKKNIEDKIDDTKKEEILENAFKKSNICIIFGAAGTGKSTLIRYFSRLFLNQNVLFLTNTHTTKKNLMEKISWKINISTTKKYLKEEHVENYDLIIIDECGVISNNDILKILRKNNYKKMLLVGDSYQLEPIEFGIWFQLLINFKNANSFELKNNYRTKDTDILNLWEKVRSFEINELIGMLSRYSIDKELSDELLLRRNDTKDDSIVLCLNYDGLYGINNINDFIQQQNKNKGFIFNNVIFKIDDPILFNEHYLLKKHSIFNNTKGLITNIEEIDENKIKFDIKIIDNFNIENYKDEKIIIIDHKDDNGNIFKQLSIIIQKTDSEQDNDFSSFNYPPFTLAYAISIHKSQGLEFDKVKIVISDDMESKISHNIFYTAITRAKKEILIFWSKNTQRKIINNFKKNNYSKTFNLLKGIKNKK